MHQTETLRDRLRAEVPAQLLPPDVNLSFLPPGKESERPFLWQMAGSQLPGWLLAFILKDKGLPDTVAEQRIASYIWIGVLVFATVIVLAALALRLVRRQVALTQLRNDLVANVTHELEDAPGLHAPAGGHAAELRSRSTSRPPANTSSSLRRRTSGSAG